MRKLLAGAALALLLVLALSGTAGAYTCKSPQHEIHGGPVYQPVLWQFISEEEIYLAVEHVQAGCPVLMAEEPEGELARRTFTFYPDGLSALVPHLPFGTFRCYTLFETQAEPELESNRFCVFPLEHERLD